MYTRFIFVSSKNLKQKIEEVKTVCGACADPELCRKEVQKTEEAT